jgi:predicted permease
MIDIFLKIFAVFSIIITGFMLKEYRFLDVGSWRNLEKLTFKLLLPLLLFHFISRVEFIKIIDTFILASYLCLIVVFIVSFYLLVTFFCRTTFTNKGCDIQSLTRFSNYVGLMSVMIIYGDQGIDMYVILIPVLMIFINVIISIALSRFDNWRLATVAIARSLATNSILIASILGMAWSLLDYQMGGVPMPQVITTWITIISNSTLAMGLLATGAAISRNHIKKMPQASVLFVIVLKMLLVPIMVIAILYYQIIDLTVLVATQNLDYGLMATVIVILFALPDAPSSITQARILGHDAEYVVPITVISILISAITIPMIIYVCQILFV